MTNIIYNSRNLYKVLNPDLLHENGAIYNSRNLYKVLNMLLKMLIILYLQ